MDCVSLAVEDILNIFPEADEAAIMKAVIMAVSLGEDIYESIVQRAVNLYLEQDGAIDFHDVQESGLTSKLQTTSCDEHDAETGACRARSASVSSTSLHPAHCETFSTTGASSIGTNVCSDIHTEKSNEYASQIWETEATSAASRPVSVNGNRKWANIIKTQSNHEVCDNGDSVVSVLHSSNTVSKSIGNDRWYVTIENGTCSLDDRRNELTQSISKVYGELLNADYDSKTQSGATSHHLSEIDNTDNETDRSTQADVNNNIGGIPIGKDTLTSSKTRCRNKNGASEYDLNDEWPTLQTCRRTHSAHRQTAFHGFRKKQVRVDLRADDDDDDDEWKRMTNSDDVCVDIKPDLKTINQTLVMNAKRCKDNSTPKLVNLPVKDNSTPKYNLPVKDNSTPKYNLPVKDNSTPKYNLSVKDNSSPKYNLSMKDSSTPKLVNLPVKDNSRPKYNLPVKDNSTPKLVKFPVKDNSTPKLVNLPVKDNSTPKLVNLSVKDNNTPNLVNLPVKDNSTPKLVNLPVKDNSTPKLVNLSVKDNSTPKLVNLPVKDNSTPKLVNLPVKDNSTPKLVNLPVKDNSTPKSVNLPVKDSTPKLVNLPVKDNSTPKLINLSVKDNSTPKLVNLPVKDNSTPKYNLSLEDISLQRSTTSHGLESPGCSFWPDLRKGNIRTENEKHVSNNTDTHAPAGASKDSNSISTSVTSTSLLMITPATCAVAINGVFSSPVTESAFSAISCANKSSVAAFVQKGRTISESISKDTSGRFFSSKDTLGRSLSSSSTEYACVPSYNQSAKRCAIPATITNLFNSCRTVETVKTQMITTDGCHVNPSTSTVNNTIVNRNIQQLPNTLAKGTSPSLLPRISHATTSSDSPRSARVASVTTATQLSHGSEPAIPHASTSSAYSVKIGSKRQNECAENHVLEKRRLVDNNSHINDDGNNSNVVQSEIFTAEVTMDSLDFIPKTALKSSESVVPFRLNCCEVKKLRAQSECLFADDITCSACVKSCVANKVVSCTNSHVTCKHCLKVEINKVISSDKMQLSCPVTACSGEITLDELSVLAPSFSVDILKEDIHKKQLSASLKTIQELEGIVSCPVCSYSAQLDSSVQIFTCANGGCKVRCCRYCKATWHQGKEDQHEGCILLQFTGLQCLRDMSVLPDNWTRYPGPEYVIQEQVVSCVNVPLDSSEGLAVSTYFSLSSHTSLLRLRRIQNRTCWETYVLKRKHMLEQIGEQHLHERFLFHGTSSNCINKICREGFDFRRNSVNGTSFGKGNYFSTIASYSETFAKGCKSLFLVRVLCGWSAVGHHGNKHPPYSQAGRMFDSCVDNVSKPSMYIVYSNEQCYPAYLFDYA